MTTRVSGLTVILSQDMREDDVELLVNAIRQMRNVLDVRAIESDKIAEMRAKLEVGLKIREALRDICGV